MQKKAIFYKKNFLIYGFGKSGYASYKFLYKKNNCKIIDDNKKKIPLKYNNEVITYKVANSSSYFTESNVPPNPNITYLKIYRDTSLEGRANIYVAPETTGETTVMINNRYVVSVKISFDTYLYAVLYNRHIEQNQFGRRLDNPQPDPVSFNTNSVSTGDITCSSTGKFESDILKLART